MNVITRKDIERVVEFLKNSAEKEEVLFTQSAIINMVCVLEQALENYEDDIYHPHLYLEVSKAMTVYDVAVRECCNTDCVHLCAGICPFVGIEEKCKCNRILSYLEDEP